jgi:hypothetical protein
MKEDIKKTAPLDTSFPTMRVPSDDEKTQAVKAATTTQSAKSKFAINTWALTLKEQQTHHESPYLEDLQNETYQEAGSRAKNVMTIARHHPQDHQNQTTGPTLTMMQGANRRQGPDEVQDGPLRHGGGGGHN